MIRTFFAIPFHVVGVAFMGIAMVLLAVGSVIENAPDEFENQRDTR